MSTTGTLPAAPSDGDVVMVAESATPGPRRARSASTASVRRRRPDLPGQPPRSASKRRVKPWVVSVGRLDAGHRAWVGLWNFSNKPKHKHAFKYSRSRSTNLAESLVEAGIISKTSEAPVPAIDLTAASVAATGAPTVLSSGIKTAAAAGAGSGAGAGAGAGGGASAAGGGTAATSTAATTLLVPSSGAGAGGGAGSGGTGSGGGQPTPVGTPDNADRWGVYKKPTLPPPSRAPFPSGLVWEGGFRVPAAKAGQESATIAECFVLWVTGELDDEPGVFSVLGHGRNEIGEFGFTGWYESDQRSMDVAKMYITPKKKRPRKLSNATPAEAIERRVSKRKRTLSRRLAYGAQNEEEEEAIQRRKTDSESKTIVTRGTAPAKTPASTPPGRRARFRVPATAEARPVAAPRRKKPPATWSRMSSLGGRASYVQQVWAGTLSRCSQSGSYQGAIHKGVPHGHGTALYPSGLMYEGAWVNGVETGWGILSDLTDRVLYEGEFVDGKFSGMGVYFFPNGDMYEGDWKDNAFHGVGRFRRVDGSSFEGDWRDGRRHGRGVLSMATGIMYSGEWAHDTAHGRGTLNMPLGPNYSGTWEAGLFAGKGECQYPDGSRYQGPFKAGVRYGRGTLTFPNGAVYNGRFKEDRLEGSGTLNLEHPVPADDGSDTILVPVSLQADLEKVHLRAGFTSTGM